MIEIKPQDPNSLTKEELGFLEHLYISSDERAGHVEPGCADSITKAIAYAKEANLLNKEIDEQDGWIYLSQDHDLSDDIVALRIEADKANDRG